MALTSNQTVPKTIESIEDTISFAIDQMVSARRKRESLKDQVEHADRDLSHWADVAWQLVVVLPPERKREFLKRLREATSAPAPQPREGTTYGNVVGLLTRQPLREWSVPKIKLELESAGVEADPKSIHNVLHYLRRTGHLRRIGRGNYVVRDLGMGDVTDELSDEEYSD